MGGFLSRVIIEPLDRSLERVIQFLPSLLTSILILVIGIVIGVLLRVVFLRLFKAVNLDRLSERLGMAEMLHKGGISDTLSTLLSKIIGWLTILVFIIISLSSLDVPAVKRLLEGLFLYLPNVFVAVLILFLGYLLSNFLGRAALIASVNAGIRVSGLIGRVVKFTVFVLSGTMALEQLGIGKETVIIAFAIIFGGIVLAFAISFGLGGRDIAKDYLEKKLLKGEERDDIEHL
jgi:Mechanosensitive ion channel, conserved TM helix